MSEILKPGDVVRLRSGGPTMTVASLERESPEDVVVRCVWFDECGGLRYPTHAFRAAMLERVRRPAAPGEDTPRDEEGRPRPGAHDRSPSSS